ncbi:MarR family winged helix-turn-helix transcriptional regulator [Paraburkholderia sp. MM5482-R1]|uniref:MarR family winged helix-turn-helix transcriptional regulator n=1 Tax=unclassified Paraburkholderia TaxID=2615204 RepID=UPI003D209EBA
MTPCLRGAIIKVEDHLQTTQDSGGRSLEGVIEHTLEEDYCFAVNQAKRYVSRIYNRHLAQASVTVGQLEILMVLREHEFMTMIDLGEILVMERTTLARAIKPLISARLLLKARHAQYGRRCVLSLTEAGLDKVEQGEVHLRAAQLELEKLYGSAKAARLQAELLSLIR